METHLADFIKDTPHGREAESILRACVHCGFCTATCPTYQLLGDELDGPRGRIYLMKQMLEGEPVTAKTQLHLDRCLTCRSCETTCPSGVRYGRLVEIGREVLEAREVVAATIRPFARKRTRSRAGAKPAIRTGTPGARHAGSRVVALRTGAAASAADAEPLCRSGSTRTASTTASPTISAAAACLIRPRIRSAGRESSNGSRYGRPE